MTRDQKLALLIGFALTLAVGVLISDHLSRGGRASLDSGLATVADPVLPSVPITAEDAAADWRPRWTSEASERPRVPSVQTGDASGADNPRLPIGLHAVADRPGIHIPGATQESFTPNRADAPSRSNAQGRNNAQSRNIYERSTNSTRSRTSSLRVHHVRTGESLFRIAEQYYGTGHVWRELARYNAGRVSPDGGVRIGVALRIPPIAELDPDAQDQLNQDALSQDESSRANEIEPARAAPARFGSYTVRRGDTFGEIAQKLMGSVSRSSELLELNANIVSDAHLIRPGMVLRYPLGPDA